MIDFYEKKIMIFTNPTRSYRAMASFISLAAYIYLVFALSGFRSRDWLKIGAPLVYFPLHI